MGRDHETGKTEVAGREVTKDSKWIELVGALHEAVGHIGFFRSAAMVSEAKHRSSGSTSDRFGMSNFRGGMWVGLPADRRECPSLRLPVYRAEVMRSNKVVVASSR